VRRTLAPLLPVVLLVVLVAGCAHGDEEPLFASTLPTTTPSTVTAASSTTAPSPAATTSSPSTSSTSTSPSTSTSTSSTVPGALVEQIGTSAGGRPIVAERRGTPGGTPVVVIGVIHGNEDAGVAIVADLRDMPVPAGVELWLVESVNPDGQAADRRGNDHLVDLNRNFPHDWTPIASPGEWEYSGTGPASEPETQAMVAFFERVQPRLTIWYHQDLNRLSPAKGFDGQLRARYAELTGLPIEPVTGGTYTGVAATWVRRSVPDAVSFVVELGPTLSADQAAVHAAAVLDLAQRV
jgi:protein MpaA